MEELPCYDRDCSPESHELANFPSVGKPHAILSSREETRASQPKALSNLMNDRSGNFVPSDERKWDFILAYDDVKGKTLE